MIWGFHTNKGALVPQSQLKSKLGWRKLHRAPESLAIDNRGVRWFTNYLCSIPSSTHCTISSNASFDCLEKPGTAKKSWTASSTSSHLTSTPPVSITCLRLLISSNITSAPPQMIIVLGHLLSKGRTSFGRNGDAGDMYGL